MLERPILRSSLRSILRSCPAAHTRPTIVPAITISRVNNATHTRSPYCRRSMSTSAPRRIALTDDPEKPTERQPQEQERTPKEPTPISAEDYQQKTDQYFEKVLEKLEEMQEERGDMDVEYSQGVMNIVFPPTGTYVLNKQPPNKQIWLSSPKSGPKRFDYVVMGESQHQKGGAASDEWIYLRDGTSLTTLLRSELEVDVGSKADE